MPAIFNVKKARVRSDGIVQRPKYQGVAPISMAYGLYLGETCDESGSFKAFFLMNSWVAGTGEVTTPSEIRSNPRMISVPLDVFPFSKKFSVADELVESLVTGEEYWFFYTSEPVSKPIEGKMVTYEQLDLICVADVSGPDGIRTLLPLLKLSKGSSQVQPS
jgi:hypothetical protein